MTLTLIMSNLYLFTVVNARPVYQCYQLIKEDKVKMGEYLTAEQIEKFQKDGILVVENFLSQDEVKNMREEIMKLVQSSCCFSQGYIYLIKSIHCVNSCTRTLFS